jgi:hypothetical protein
MKLQVLDNATAQFIINETYTNDTGLSTALTDVQNKLKERLQNYDKGCYTVLHKDGARVLNVFTL